MIETSAAAVRPWYREPMVWLMIAIPALTVPAGIITLLLALAHPSEAVGPSVIEQVARPAAGR